MLAACPSGRSFEAASGRRRYEIDHDSKRHKRDNFYTANPLVPRRRKIPFGFAGMAVAPLANTPVWSRSSSQYDLAAPRSQCFAFLFASTRLRSAHDHQRSWRQRPVWQVVKAAREIGKMTTTSREALQLHRLKFSRRRKRPSRQESCRCTCNTSEGSLAHGVASDSAMLHQHVMHGIGVATRARNPSRRKRFWT